MAYTEEACIAKISALYEKKDLSKLYDQAFIKSWNGKTSDTRREYQELFAQYIWERLVDGRLPMINVCNVKEYCTVDRQDAIRDNEEGVQRDFYFGRRKLDDKFGKPVWFELQTNREGQGKGIDLVYYNEQTEEINLFEKKYANKKEGLLRAALEVQTYYQRVKWYAVAQALLRRGLIGSLHVSKINKYILVDEQSVRIVKKLREIEAGGEGYVKKLLDAFQISIVHY